MRCRLNIITVQLEEMEIFTTDLNICMTHREIGHMGRRVTIFNKRRSRRLFLSDNMCESQNELEHHDKCYVFDNTTFAARHKSDEK